jgi:hypothetical protein
MCFSVIFPNVQYVERYSVTKEEEEEEEIYI